MPGCFFFHADPLDPSGIRMRRITHFLTDRVCSHTCTSQQVPSRFPEEGMLPLRYLRERVFIAIRFSAVWIDCSCLPASIPSFLAFISKAVIMQSFSRFSPDHLVRSRRDSLRQSPPQQVSPQFPEKVRSDQRSLQVNTFLLL